MTKPTTLEQKQETKHLGSWYMSGTTCCYYVKRVWAAGPFWLMHKAGHPSESGGMFNRTVWCAGHYRLFDMRTVNDSGYGGWPGGHGFVKEWLGRWSKAKEAEARDIVKERTREEI